MPDTREHRGPHPDDGELFAPAALPHLRAAVADFSLLLTKGYAGKGALKLVGDRFSLTQRQRLAVMRSSCSDQQLAFRLARRVPLEVLTGRSLAIDGYNLLITIEAALSGGLIFRGRDGCFRDLASIHGTYRKVEETVPAVKLIGEFLTAAGIPRVTGVSPACVEGVPPSNREQDALATRGRDARDTNATVLWLLDSPVSNSGRLKTLLGELAQENGWPWEIRLSLNPDAELSSRVTVPSSQFPANGQMTDSNRPLSPVIVSTDSVVLDAGPEWANLAAEIIAQRLPQATIIDLDVPVTWPAQQATTAGPAAEAVPVSQ